MMRIILKHLHSEETVCRLEGCIQPQAQSAKITATPGKVLPSIHSKNAPPAAET